MDTRHHRKRINKYISNGNGINFGHQLNKRPTINATFDGNILLDDIHSNQRQSMGFVWVPVPLLLQQLIRHTLNMHNWEWSSNNGFNLCATQEHELPSRVQDRTLHRQQTLTEGEWVS